MTPTRAVAASLALVAGPLWLLAMRDTEGAGVALVLGVVAGVCLAGVVVMGRRGRGRPSGDSARSIPFPEEGGKLP
ncbi:MAG: hypothetical protein EHM35_00185 [Planctomycetaceae bacterium]|nr:MAG: hypothetical protein EHM35_00185 [Planctomycetaceae bacterium]